MDWWQLSLLIGAIATMVLSANVSRAWLWIMAAGASFVASTAYARLALPHPPFFTMMCDAAVCLVIYFLASRQWEVWLFRAFQLSVLISLIYLVGFIGSHYWYVAALEAVNWAALLLILGTATLQWIGARDEMGSRAYWAWRVHSAYGGLFSPRKDNPFHKG